MRRFFAAALAAIMAAVLLPAALATQHSDATLTSAAAFIPPGRTVERTVDVPAIADAGVIPYKYAQPQGGAAKLALYDRNGEFDRNFLRFDTSVLPAEARMLDASLVIQVQEVTDPVVVELGFTDGAWSEDDVVVGGAVALDALHVTNEPAVTWLGVKESTDKDGELTFPVDETLVNNANFVLRGQTPKTQYTYFGSRESGIPAVLRVRYRTFEPDIVPDVGDAPDSTNHYAGTPNTAYADTGVAGNFPTVVDPAVGAEVGPFHRNDKLDDAAYLGDHISSEEEADIDDDDDQLNNILLTRLGTVVDRADHDRGDDGWRNRAVTFEHCDASELVVRVSRRQTSSATMYLNVWFDGNRDGDWSDLAPVPCVGGGIASEWIVRDSPIDLSEIDAGGFNDFLVSTYPVPNGDPYLSHWVRFSLTDQPVGDLSEDPEQHPNGAGPAGGYDYGETEDYLYLPPPAPVQQVPNYRAVYTVTESDDSTKGDQSVDYELVFTNMWYDAIQLDWETDIDDRLWLQHYAGVPEADPPVLGQAAFDIHHPDGDFWSNWGRLGNPAVGLAELDQGVEFEGTIAIDEELHLRWTGKASDHFVPSFGCGSGEQWAPVPSALDLWANGFHEQLEAEIDLWCGPVATPAPFPAYSVTYNAVREKTDSDDDVIVRYDVVLVNEGGLDLAVDMRTDIDDRMNLDFDIGQPSTNPPLTSLGLQHVDGSSFSNFTDLEETTAHLLQQWVEWDGVVPVGEELHLSWLVEADDRYVPRFGCTGFDSEITIGSVLNLTVHGDSFDEEADIDVPCGPEAVLGEFPDPYTITYTTDIDVVTDVLPGYEAWVNYEFTVENHTEFPIQVDMFTDFDPRVWLEGREPVPPLDLGGTGVRHLNGSSSSNWLHYHDTQEKMTGEILTYDEVDQWAAFDGEVEPGETLHLGWRGRVSDTFVPDLGCVVLPIAQVRSSIAATITIDGVEEVHDLVSVDDVPCPQEPADCIAPLPACDAYWIAVTDHGCPLRTYADCVAQGHIEAGMYPVD